MTRSASHSSSKDIGPRATADGDRTSQTRFATPPPTLQARQASPADSYLRSADRPRDLMLHEPPRDAPEIAGLKQENTELRERILQLEADQAMILDINQMLLAKLHLLSDDFLAQGPARILQP